MPARYPLRALKSIVLFFVLAKLLLALVYFTGADRASVSFLAFLQAQGDSLWKMALFLGVFGLIYPFIGYIAQRIPCARAFTEADQAAVRKLFADARFVLEREEAGKLFFRHVNPAARFTRVYEDTITVDCSSNPLVVEGLRRDAYRLARAVERYVRQRDEQ